MMRLAIFLLMAAAGFAAEPVTETHSYDLPANGTIHLRNAAGDVAIEAWDQSRVELTVVKSAEAELLDKIKVSGEASGDTLNIVSSYPKYPKIERPFRWTMHFDLSYRIRAPRTAKLIIDEYSGQVNVRGMTGDIRASGGNGDIFLLMPDGKYAVHAKTKIGEVISDFPGKQKRGAWLFGYEFAGDETSGSKLDLRIRTGTVTILKMRVPVIAD